MALFKKKRSAVALGGARYFPAYELMFDGGSNFKEKTFNGK